ncbi:hypothetical protein Cylst_0197 [Cylindrospermum stagnale PCC 7417]|uniref:Uncharacterized protein n=1 Tax=Cylindrospermum stagnale PCC 7417 TaxID=56107 RepID=K9WQY7_9NOST|nr:hypothetical protein [Cylindrospermum stagnale]AFZ22573.1 hypothetical protein Cylst_0197 [Cylindrospermum stagnale PCC 7417]
MAPSVTDKTLIPTKAWRRHTDPPLLWITVAISSVSLHLLGFWLMRSSNEFKPWFPQVSPGSIAIDFVDISPSAKPIAKSTSIATKVSPKPPTTQPKLTATLAPEPTPTSIFVPEPRLTPTPTPTPTPRPKPEATPTPTPTPTPKPEATPTPTPTNPVGSFPGNRRQQVILGEGKLLPKDPLSGLASPTTNASPSPTTNPSPSPTTNASPSQTANPSPSPTANPSPSQTANPSPSPTANPSPSPTSQTPESQTGGGLIAAWKILNPEEQREKSRSDRPPDDLILPTIRTGEGEIDLTGNTNQNLPKGVFLVSLVIDNIGKCIGAEVQGSDLPPQEKKKLAEFAKETFQKQQFQPARFPDGKTPPSLSNVFVEFTISDSQP